MSFQQYFRLFLTVFLFGLSASALPAQNLPGLAAYYSFEGSLEDVSGVTANAGSPLGNPEYGCGLLTGVGTGQALILGDALNSVDISGPLLDEFNREDLSISFYINPTGTTGIQNILSKIGQSCNPDSSLNIQYLPGSRTIRARFTETSLKQVSLEAVLPENQCWHHVLIVRDDIRIRMYFNGLLVDEGATAGVIDISNDGILIIGDADCLPSGETPFEGRLDELSIFSRALDPQVAAGLYVFPDRILTPDTQLFLGESLQVELGPSCGSNFSWAPAAGVALPNEAEPIITPASAGLMNYVLSISEAGSSCVAMDTLTVQVIDPDDLDCSRLFLPAAFTPNGDGLNDGFGISNPFAVQDLVSFEIFDRWGSRVYTSRDAFERWDGDVNGSPLNPGVLLYRLVTNCDGQEQLKTGSVTLIR